MTVRLMAATLLVAAAAACGNSDADRLAEFRADDAATLAPAPRPAEPRTAESDAAAPAREARLDPNLEQAGPAQKPTATTGEVKVNADAVILKDFNDRVDAYVGIHNKAKGQAPALKESEDAAKISAAQDGLANQIRALRADAKAGDIFTPAIRDKFRRLMYPELKGEDGADAKKILKDDAPPPGAVPLKVNAKYTADSMPTVPSNLLLNLPTLPKELEYRIIGKNLILLDVDASVIVDYIPNAIR